MDTIPASRSDIELHDKVACSIVLSEHEEFARLYCDELPKSVAHVMSELGIEFWQKRPEKYLIWLQWGRKYEIGFDVVVRIVVSHYRKILKREGKSLGITLATLTSADAERLIAEGLESQGGSEPESPIRRSYKSISDYAKGMISVRKREESVRASGKPYRGSGKWGFGK